VSTLGLKSDVVETWLVANLVLQKRLNTHRPFWGGGVLRRNRWLAPPANIFGASGTRQLTNVVVYGIVMQHRLVSGVVSALWHNIWRGEVV
jgi:hypothetical protein